MREKRPRVAVDAQIPDGIGLEDEFGSIRRVNRRISNFKYRPFTLVQSKYTSKNSPPQ